MRAVLDACVLYPTVLRELLLAVAARGLLVPVWSDRILEEWRRAAARAGPEVAATAGVEIALLTDRMPGALVPGAPAPDDLVLPDADDLHVVATALAAAAPVIVTLNLRDFPARALARHGVSAHHPDALLLGLHADTPAPVEDAAEEVRARTEAISGRGQPLRPLLKRAGLPRLGKTLDRSGGGA